MFRIAYANVIFCVSLFSSTQCRNGLRRPRGGRGSRVWAQSLSTDLKLAYVIYKRSLIRTVYTEVSYFSFQVIVYRSDSTHVVSFATN